MPPVEEGRLCQAVPKPIAGACAARDASGLPTGSERNNHLSLVAFGFVALQGAFGGALESAAVQGVL